MTTIRNPGAEPDSSIAPGKHKTAIIIGAGPAGLTAAYELLTRTDIKPIVLERTDYMGGISRTVNFKGNRIDIGGHRFFSKSDRVMNWWLRQMPIQQNGSGSQRITYHGMTREIDLTGAGTRANPAASDLVMLVRKRKSRIYFLGKFFDYPITLTLDTLMKMGFLRTLRFGFSYLRSMLVPLRDVKSLEDFLINRFGRELYKAFFKSYTEKVWGVPCHKINAEWGEQRIKGLSIWKAIMHFLNRPFSRTRDAADKNTESSLIEQFLYPKLGSGQMWESVARQVIAMGGEIVTNCKVTEVHSADNRINAVTAIDNQGRQHTFRGDYFFSTMAVKDLIQAMKTEIPDHVKEVSNGLLYRDFITVGLVVKELKVSEKNQQLIKDNWIYIQESGVVAGRLQIFNNWSPYMVANPEHVWIGVEYFCYETDDLWKKPDVQMAAFAVAEMDKIGILKEEDVLDSVVIHMPKTYPAYFGTYNRFNEVREFLDNFENLFLIGRNGMHKYNNQDHSMLTAMLAVDNIAAGITDKSNLWAVNTEMEYHEASTEQKQEAASF
jgi:protoporphyrinogen oxidase